MDQQHVQTDQPAITKRDVPFSYTKVGVSLIIIWNVIWLIALACIGFRPTVIEVVIGIVCGLIVGIVTGPIWVAHAALVSNIKAKYPRGVAGYIGFKTETQRLELSNPAGRNWRSLVFAIIIGGAMLASLLSVVMRLIDPALVESGSMFDIYLIFVVVAYVAGVSKVLRWYNELPD